MGKRKGNGNGGSSKKKFRVGGFIEPNSSGIYATCARGKEQQCRKELMNLFSEKIEQFYDLDNLKDLDDDEKDTPVISIEDQIKNEINGLQDNKNSKKEFLKPIDLGCECLIFIKTRRPVEPATFVERICKESSESNVKNTRYTQKLSPITFSVSPSLDEIKKLATKVLEPHFHQDKSTQKAYKFAIQVSKRNFSTLEKPVIIKTVAECVGRDHGHSVDLKKYDKLILIECFKTNVGMSVVNNYDEYDKFNLQQIFEKHLGVDENALSRVKNISEKSIESTDVKSGNNIEENIEIAQQELNQKNEHPEEQDNTKDDNGQK